MSQQTTAVTLLTPELISLVKPEVLLSMSDREVEILRHTITHEIATNKAITEILQKRIDDVLNKLNC